jgi:hypothetical protein
MAEKIGKELENWFTEVKEAIIAGIGNPIGSRLCRIKICSIYRARFQKTFVCWNMRRFQKAAF